MTTPTTLRAFIAIELPAELRRELGQVIERLRQAVPESAVRWVRPEGIHLTLKFLGDMPVTQASQVQGMIAAAAAEATPFEYVAEGLGCFPNLKQPRVVWAGLREPSGVLAHLQRAVEQGAARLGYSRESGERDFNPHLTLGRVGRQAGTAAVRRVAEAVQTAGAGEMGSFRADALSLMKSELQPGGSVYSQLFSTPLGQG